MRLLFAKSMTRFFRLVADTFFAKRYGHRAVVLETVAGVPGMVAGMLLHFQSLRKMKTGYGHYGQRIVFGPEGYLWISSGDRQRGDETNIFIADDWSLT